MLNALRWIMLVPASMLSWWVVFIMGVASYCFFDREYCHLEACSNAGSVGMSFSVYFFPALSAVVAGSVATFVAPSHKRYVVFAAYVVGAGGVALLVLNGLADYGQAAFTLVASLLAAFYLSRYAKRLGVVAQENSN